MADVTTMRARIDVVFAAETLSTDPSEKVRLIVDALEAGPECLMGAQQSADSQVSDSRFVASLQECADDVPVLLCSLVNLGPALAQTAHRFVGIVHSEHDAAPEQDQTWTLRIVCSGNGGRFASEDAYLAGVAVRGLLIELSHVNELPSDVQLLLTEQAGFAQAAAGGFPDDLSALAAGSAAHRVEASALHQACQRNTVAIVPQVSS